jgi:cytochrome c
MKSFLLLLAAGAMCSSGFVAAQSAADLLKSKNCMSCHDVDKKKVGPAFKETAAKYKDDKGAEAKIVAALKEGKGHPTKVAATDAELKILAAHVLAQK